VCCLRSGERKGWRVMDERCGIQDKRCRIEDARFRWQT
jgi:hypothetical protein